MKKTLIALAAVAATSAFAQSSVSITGEVAYGYRTTSTNNVKAKGFGLDTSEFTIAATEDLGGGMKASASMSLQDIGGADASGEKADPVRGNNMSLGLSGGFGSIGFAVVQIGSGIRGLAQAGAPVNNMETEVLAAKGVGQDSVKYTSPKMGGFAFSIGQVDAVTGLGKGSSSGETTSLTAGVTYAAGPIKAALDMTDWNSNAAGGKPDSRYRISGNYNLGVATVGAGFENQKLVGGGNNKYTMLGVSAPIGKAVTVGYAYVKNDTTALPGTKTGSTMGVSYSLSKRTSLTANYAIWERDETATAVDDKKTTILMVHTF